MTVTRTVEVLTLEDVERVLRINFSHYEQTPILSGPTGVYCHVEIATGAVLYVGSASGAGGLRRRLGDELRWIAETTNNYTDHRSRRLDRAAVIAGLAEHRSDAYFYETDTGADARDLERQILHLSVLLTGLPPLLRGWNIRGASQVSFNSVREKLEQAVVDTVADPS
jgi:hypothetical protein